MSVITGSYRVADCQCKRRPMKGAMSKRCTGMVRADKRLGKKRFFMAEQKKIRVWINMLVEYDGFGGAQILKTFMKPAADSPIKMKPKKGSLVNKKKNVNTGVEEELW